MEKQCKLVNSAIGAQLSKVEEYLFQTLSSQGIEAHVNAMCMHVVRAGGKRLRPSLALAAAYALGNLSIAEEDIIKFAAATELLHTATLIHDDVIDVADVRRGNPTLNATDGNHAAVLAGDYMFTRCFFALQNLPDLFKISSEAVTALVSGELAQLEKVGDLNLSIADYEQTIYCKTGALFVLATTGIAIHTKQDPQIIDALKIYGTKLGIGFQVVDDILDYTSDSHHLGKTVGEDLTDGRITLPLIFCRDELKGTDLENFKNSVENCDLKKVLEFLDKTNAQERCHNFARKAAQEAILALKVLPPSSYRELLESFAYKAIERTN